MKIKKMFFILGIIFSLFLLKNVSFAYSEAETSNVIVYESDSPEIEIKIYPLLNLQDSCGTFVSLEDGIVGVPNYSQYYLYIYENEEEKPVFYTFHYDEQDPYSFKKYREKTIYTSEASDIEVYEGNAPKNFVYYSNLYDEEENFKPCVIEYTHFVMDEVSNKCIFKFEYEIYVPNGTIFRSISEGENLNR